MYLLDLKKQTLLFITIALFLITSCSAQQLQQTKSQTSTQNHHQTKSTPSSVPTNEDPAEVQEGDENTDSDIGTKTQAIKIPAFQTGDIIFHESKSSQAQAIKEATNAIWTHVAVIVEKKSKGKSSWYVYEAIGKGVGYTPLESFIRRGVNLRFIVKRVDPVLFIPSDDNVEKLISALEKFDGKPYDYLFEWQDGDIYCSELVWKGYNNAFGFTTGEVQKLKDLNLNGPAVKRLIREREKRFGKEKNLEEPIVTPASMFNSENLYQIYDSAQAIQRPNQDQKQQQK